MVNQYETVFILTPVLSESQAEESVKKYEQLIKDMGGKIVHSEKWGLKKLAYPIEKKSSGFYYLYEFKADSESVDKLSVAFKRDERVLRNLVVKMNKHAIAYAEKKRNNVQESSKNE